MDMAPLVLVVGMHRSGTSLLGGILQQLGIALPGETIKGDCHNPEGYFEWDEVVAIQERLLIDLERWWPASEGILDLPEGWLQHPATLKARSNLKSLLKIEARRQKGIWAIKDPRCSRLLPLWILLAGELSIPLRLILALRDPSEVVASLVHRDGPLTGMDVNRAQQLWWKHNLEVVHTANEHGLPLLVVDFAKWFLNPDDQLESLLHALPSLQVSEQQLSAAAALIQPRYRRSLSRAGSFELSSRVCRLHRQLLRCPLPTNLPSSSPPRCLKKNSASNLKGVSLSDSPESWSDWLEQHKFFPAPRISADLLLSCEVRIQVCGYQWKDFQPHLWLQRAPLACLERRLLDLEQSQPHELILVPDWDAEGEVSNILLNFELPPLERRIQWLGHLRAQSLVFDPDPARVLLLRACGVFAWWLDPEEISNCWLDQAAAVDQTHWAKKLGLAPPEKDALIVLGPGGYDFDHALANESRLAETITPSISYVPCWSELIVNRIDEGLARAGWLQFAARSAARLFVAGDLDLSEQLALLADLNSPILVLPPRSTPDDLRSHHFGASLKSLAENRPLPVVEQRFHWSDGQDPEAAVVVSLFNYGDRITSALDSVAAQTSKQLELIVVDDASTDGGVEYVKAWMQAQLQNTEHHFVRLLLLCHQSNAGLAAARNTAFRAAQAPWCFVLDSDNALYPEAVEACLGLAKHGGDDLAVVHPLIAVEAEPGRPDETRSLVGTLSWLREHFLEGNVVDAMALVRRSAWEKASGYTHIEGGWEDFDFWCKLLEAGFHGVQCPHILAVYRSHAQSMSHTATNSNWLALSRTLQDRHPWLELPLASP